jgi:F0F1-type ATP synthase membrane subunit a
MLQAMLTKFAAEGDGPAIHITPERIFDLSGQPISNSVFYGWVSSAVIIVLLVFIARHMTLKPKRGLFQFVELGTEFIISTLSGSLGSRAKAVKYAPYFVTTFFFVMLSNWLGLMPGVGEALTLGETPRTSTVHSRSKRHTCCGNCHDDFRPSVCDQRVRVHKTHEALFCR